MAANPTPEEELRLLLRVYQECGKNQSEAARILGLKRPTFCNRLQRAEQLGLTTEEFTVPEMPPGDLDVEELLDFGCRRFEERHALARAQKWIPIKIKLSGPIGICWFGDPHIDDNGCNLPLLRRDTRIVRDTEGMFGAHIGDTTNNWIGRLMRLFADQDTSQETARKYAKWLLVDSGVPWLLWLMGNHDEWNNGSEILRGMNVKKVLMQDWRAQIKLVFPNGREARIDARHDFKGHSMWNSLHGLQKAAHMKEMAHLYIAGHTHNWALHKEESASREFVYWLARCRGYKFIDSFADKLGHASQQEGASIVSIFDPDAKTQGGFVQCFDDVEEGADFLRFKRNG